MLKSKSSTQRLERFTISSGMVEPRLPLELIWISFIHRTIKERKVFFRFPFTLKYKKLMIRFVNVVLTKHNFSNTIIGITNESCPVTFVRTREIVGARTPTNLDTFCSRTTFGTEVEHSHNFLSSG